MRKRVVGVESGADLIGAFLEWAGMVVLLGCLVLLLLGLVGCNYTNPHTGNPETYFQRTHRQSYERRMAPAEREARLWQRVGESTRLPEE